MVKSTDQLSRSVPGANFRSEDMTAVEKQLEGDGPWTLADAWWRAQLVASVFGGKLWKKCGLTSYVCWKIDENAGFTQNKSGI